jgi:hypothetical protein
VARKKQPEETKPWAPSSVRRAAERAEKPKPFISGPPKTSATNAEIEQFIIFLAFFDQRSLYDTQGRLLPVDMLDEYTARALCSIKVVEDCEGYGEQRVVACYTKEFSIETRIEALKLLMKFRGLDGELKTKDKDRLQEIVDAMKHGPVKK